MKKLFSMLISAVLFFYLFCFSASAAAVFSAEDAQTKNNRIFTVTLSGTGDEVLCAARFDFTYDYGAVEFRSAKAADSGSAVKYYEEEGCLRLIFLNENGVDLSGGRQLFTVDFKAENLTEDRVIDFTVSDCVNAGVESFDCTGGSINVTLTESGEASFEEDSENSGASSKGESGLSISASAGVYSSPEASAADGFETANPGSEADNPAEGEIIAADGVQSASESGDTFARVGESDDTAAVFAAGAVITAALIAVFGIAYHIGRKENEGASKPPDK